MRTSGLFRVYEPHGDNDSPTGQVHLPDARLDEGKRRTGVELQHVVPRVLQHLSHLPEQPAALLLHAEPDELEDVELVLVGEARQRRARDGELGSPPDLAVEADHRPAAGTVPRRDDGCGLTARVERRALREYPLPLARALD